MNESPRCRTTNKRNKSNSRDILSTQIGGGDDCKKDNNCSEDTQHNA